MLDRDGSRTPVQFHIANDNGLHPVDAQVVQAATKWKRLALRQFGLGPGEGLCTDMRAVRKDYFREVNLMAVQCVLRREEQVSPQGREPYGRASPLWTSVVVSPIVQPR